MRAYAAKTGEYQKELFEIYSRYEESKKQNNYVDYHDHVFLPYQLLLKDEELRIKYRNRYRYIFIDEFQDTDFAQGYLISMLYNPGINSIMIVGDDDQGIYSFRGACIENILNFHKWDAFREHKINDYYLTTNFRSGANIINAAGRVIGENKGRFTKSLMPEYDEKYSEVLFFAENTLREEAAEIAKNIKCLLSSGMKLKDIAILARRKRFKEIINELQKHNLKYEVVGSKGFFYEPEILFIISWLMLLEDTGDEIYILYLLQSQKYKISDRDIFFLKQDTNINGSTGRNDMMDCILNSSKNSYISESAKKRLKEFLEEFDFYLKQAQFLKLGELVNLIFEHSGIEDELKSSFDRSVKAKIRNIEILIKIASDFEENRLGNNLDSFIIYLKDIAKTDDEDPDSFEFTNSNSIKIMSIHAAKGLEFEAVFLPMLWKNDYVGRGLPGNKFKIPAYLKMDREIYRQKGAFTNKNLFLEEIKAMKIEEERRIFYVACSRAKKFLFLSYSNFESLKHSAEIEGKKAKEVLTFLKDILKADDIYKVINKEAVKFINTQIEGMKEPGIIKIQDIIKKTSNTRKRVKISFDTGAFDSAENALSVLFPEIQSKKVVNINGPAWLNGKSLDLPEKEEGQLKEYVKNVISMKKFPDAIYGKGKFSSKNSFSLTELLTYAECPKLYELRYIHNLPEPFSERVELGEKVHKYLEHISTMTLQQNIAGGLLEGKKHIDDIVADMLSNIGEEKAMHYIDIYLKSSFFKPQDITSTMLEQLFYWKLDDSYITCKIDRMDIKKDGKFRIIDYKLSKYNSSSENAGYVNQLKAYVLGISGIFSILPEDISSYILYLENGKEKAYNFSGSLLEDFKVDIRNAIDGIRKHGFNKSNISICKGRCAFYKICAS